ncbi:MAG: hypothetical protein QXO21_00130 [Candidatus Anstonellales archaeon]
MKLVDIKPGITYTAIPTLEVSAINSFYSVYIRDLLLQLQDISDKQEKENKLILCSVDSKKPFSKDIVKEELKNNKKTIVVKNGEYLKFVCLGEHRVIKIVYTTTVYIDGFETPYNAVYDINNLIDNEYYLTRELYNKKRPRNKKDIVSIGFVVKHLVIVYTKILILHSNGADQYFGYVCEPFYGLGTKYYKLFEVDKPDENEIKNKLPFFRKHGIEFETKNIENNACSFIDLVGDDYFSLSNISNKIGIAKQIYPGYVIGGALGSQFEVS